MSEPGNSANVMELYPFLPIDRQTAVFLANLAGEKKSEKFVFLIQLLSWLTRNGHICMDLERIKEVLPEPKEGMEVQEYPELTPAFLKRLARLSVVGDGSELSPLVLKGNRLYLYRYYEYERRVIEQIRRRASASASISEQVQKAVAGLFPAARNMAGVIAGLSGPEGLEDIEDAQLRAALLALMKKFAVISGGPGTGKTTTVVKILALLLTGNPELRIALAAPTGKASLRLNESIAASLDSLDLSTEIKELIPLECVTVHRLLGGRKYSPYFQHNHTNPIPCDVLVLDEASMIDLPLFSKTLDALSPEASVILLGDHNQLASVEAGSVLGDVCAVRDKSQDTADQAGNYFLFQSEDAARVGEIAPCIVHLNKNYRFGDESGINRLSLAVNEGNSPAALKILRGDDFQDVFMQAPEQDFEETLGAAILEGFGDFARSRTPLESLQLLEEFRILCAHRRGRRGLENVNQFVLFRLKSAGLLRRIGVGKMVDPLPILITRNDYRLNLYNGDTGVLYYDELETPLVYFRDDKGGLRSYHLDSLPEYELCFAMTVHKSQGSEFKETLLILPEKRSSVLTGELLYTAVTRSRKSFKLFGQDAVFQEAVGERIKRYSGITEALRAI